MPHELVQDGCFEFVCVLRAGRHDLAHAEQLKVVDQPGGEQ